MLNDKYRSNFRSAETQPKLASLYSFGTPIVFCARRRTSSWKQSAYDDSAESGKVSNNFLPHSTMYGKLWS